MTDYSVETHFINAPGTSAAQLYVRRFRPPAGGEPVLLFHGAIESGRIFYSESGRGLAPFLARAGFDCFVADQRGRGRSRPPVARGAAYGQTETIVEDLGALADGVAALSGRRAQHWVAHSWGGVLMAAHLARFPERRAGVGSLACFGTKRRLTVRGPSELWQVEILWKRVFPVVAALWGYLPAREMHFGEDQETRSSLAGSIAWLGPSSPFVDPVDGFDYGAALRARPLPRTRHYAGSRDPFLGHPVDVRLFMEECGTPPAALRLLEGYGHIDMLTSPRAVSEHFADLVRWLNNPSC